MENKTLEELNQEYLRLVDEVQIYKTDLTELQTERAGTQGKLEAAEADYNSAKEKYDSLSAGMQSASAFSAFTVAMMKEEVNDAETEMKAAANELRQAMDADNQLAEKIEKISEKAQKANNRIDLILVSFGANELINKALVNEVQIDYGKKITEKTNKKEQLEELKTNINNDSRIQEQVAALANLLEKFDQTKANLTPENVKNITQISNEIKSTRASIRKTLKELGIKGGKITTEDIDNMITKKDDQGRIVVGELERKTEALDTEIQALTGEKNSILEKLATLKEKAQNIENGSQKYQDLTTKIDTLKSEIKNANDEKETNNARLTEIERKKQELKERQNSDSPYSNAQIETDEYMDAKDKLTQERQKLNAFIKDVYQNNPEFYKLKGEVEILKEKVKQSEAEYKNLDAEFDEKYAQAGNEIVNKDRFNSLTNPDSKASKAFEIYKNAELEVRKAMLSLQRAENIEQRDLFEIKIKEYYDAGELFKEALLEENAEANPTIESMHTYLMQQLQEEYGNKQMSADNPYNMLAFENIIERAEALGNVPVTLDELSDTSAILNKEMENMLNGKEYNEEEFWDIWDDHKNVLYELRKTDGKVYNEITSTKLATTSPRKGLFAKLRSLFGRKMPELKSESIFNDARYKINSKSIDKELERMASEVREKEKIFEENKENFENVKQKYKEEYTKAITTEVEDKLKELQRSVEAAESRLKNTPQYKGTSSEQYQILTEITALEQEEESIRNKNEQTDKILENKTKDLEDATKEHGEIDSSRLRVIKVTNPEAMTDRRTGKVDLADAIKKSTERDEDEER